MRSLLVLLLLAPGPLNAIPPIEDPPGLAEILFTLYMTYFAISFFVVLTYKKLRSKCKR